MKEIKEESFGVLTVFYYRELAMVGSGEFSSVVNKLKAVEYLLSSGYVYIFSADSLMFFKKKEIDK